MKITNECNMKLMARYPDNYFDLAIVDPPYGLNKRLVDGSGKLKNTPMCVLYRDKDWDFIPTADYWKELFRVTKNQVIFGANYFLEYLPNTRGFVCWDKKNAMPTLSACELIWTSFDKPAKIMRKSSIDLQRFHPTQKPIYIYKFMLDYCKLPKGSKILDTHLGSGSIALACYDYGFDLTACELDKDYFDQAMLRIRNHTAQQNLFNTNK